MRPHKDEIIRKIVGEWLHKADQDIRAAEKYLKAYLTPQIYVSSPNIVVFKVIIGRIRNL